MALNKAMRSKMRLHYWNDRNFGDQLSCLLVESISGREIVCSKMHAADLIAIGSLLHKGEKLCCTYREALTWFGVKQILKKICYGHNLIHVWGSGFRGCPKRGKLFFRIGDFRFHCVRGELTLQGLRAMGMLARGQEVALGDPGLLFPFLLKTLPQKRHEIGIVPHFEDVMWGRRLHEALLARGINACCIDVGCDNPLEVVEKIGSCKRILSSSLHGLVTADAFGIPNRHVRFSDLGQDREDAMFKFKDYFSAVRRKYDPIMNGCRLLKEAGSYQEWIGDSDMVQENVLANLQEGLVKSFPFERTPFWQGFVMPSIPMSGGN